MPVGAYLPNSYTGNGVTTVFPYSFRILDAAHLVVTVEDVVVTSGFTVSGVNSSTGGNVTFAVAPTSGNSVVLSRSVPYTRTTDYQNNGDLRADVVNIDLDGAEMQIQQIANRALTMPASSGISAALPTPTPNYYLHVDSLGTTLEWVPITTGTFTPGNNAWLAACPAPANMSYAATNARLAFDGGATGIAITATGRASDTPDVPASACIPGFSFAWADRTTGNKSSATAHYFEGKTGNAGVAGGLGLAREGDSVQLGPFLDITAYTAVSPNAGFAIIDWMAAGGDSTQNPTAVDSSAGQVYVSNGTRHGKGIVFQSDSLRDRTATAGLWVRGVAMEMATDHGIQWMNSTAGGTRSAFIGNNCTAGQRSLGIGFLSTAMRLYDDGDNAQFQAVKTGGSTSYLSVTGSASAAPVMSSASDASADVNMVMAPKGAGLFQLLSGLTGPVTAAITAATHTTGSTDLVLNYNRAGTVTETLPAVATNAGRFLFMRTVTANTVVSATANVTPLAGGAAGTAILAATAGKWALLWCDGATWIIMFAN